MQASGRGAGGRHPGKDGEARSGRSCAAVVATAAAGRHGWGCACVRVYDVTGAGEDAVALRKVVEASVMDRIWMGCVVCYVLRLWTIFGWPSYI